MRHINIPQDDQPLWVFGYGSLMWNPGFEHDARHIATVYGLHRRLCVASIRYRGTPEAPGLVLGLDLGGSCRGYAFRVPADIKHSVAQYLEEREMLNGVYKPVFVRACLGDDNRPLALTFRARRDHPQYIPPTCEKTLALRVSRCEGLRGNNRDYVLSTINELNSMGFEDRALQRIAGHLSDIDNPENC
ncbi:MAG: gamma-glutamylcyclotransferase [marine bacterium B5-7]|nr:MAG: gamma-glutamylcyclotransferase [marine bacterium B5-7]